MNFICTCQHLVHRWKTIKEFRKIILTKLFCIFISISFWSNLENQPPDFFSYLALSASSSAGIALRETKCEPCKTNHEWILKVTHTIVKLLWNLILKTSKAYLTSLDLIRIAPFLLFHLLLSSFVWFYANTYSRPLKLMAEINRNASKPWRFTPEKWLEWDMWWDSPA